MLFFYLHFPILEQIYFMKYFIVLSLLFSFFAGCSEKNKKEIHPEFQAFFDEYQVQGCFLLFDFNTNKTIVYNAERCNQGFLPASTFKMVNTLIGLETGIINGEEFVIPWDSVPRQVPSWNHDHNLTSAFQNSVVPWYQELARRIGTEKMQNWVSKTGFGNMDINAENLDLFWLVGNSRITPYEELNFQKRLVRDELPFHRENIDLLKKIMVMEETHDYVFRGKTGWAVMNDANVGWLVGYLENENRKYAYVINVESDNEDTTLFQKSRKEITRKIFKKLSLL